MKESAFLCFNTPPQDTENAHLAAPSRRTRRKPNHNHTRDAALALLSDRAYVACPLARRGAREPARRGVRRGAKDRTRADREPRERKADFPWRPITPTRRVRRTARRVRRSSARRARVPPAGGHGERSGGSRSVRGAGGAKGAKAQDGRFPHRELQGRTALGLPAPLPRACAARRVRRGPARTERALSAACMERRTKRRNCEGGAERPPSDRPGRAKHETRAAKSNERAARGLPTRRARRVRRAPRASRARSQQSARACGGVRERRARNGEKRVAKPRTPGARNGGPRTPRAQRAGTLRASCASGGALCAP